MGSTTFATLQALTFALFLILPISTRAQGCSQCREAVGQTPARTQTAYRRGIVVLVLAGAGVFSAGIIAIRRFR